MLLYDVRKRTSQCFDISGLCYYMTTSENIPSYPCSLIRVFVVNMKELCVLGYPKICPVKILFWIRKDNLSFSLSVSPNYPLLITHTHTHAYTHTHTHTHARTHARSLGTRICPAFANSVDQFATEEAD